MPKMDIFVQKTAILGIHEFFCKKEKLRLSLQRRERCFLFNLVVVNLIKQLSVCFKKIAQSYDENNFFLGRKIWDF